MSRSSCKGLNEIKQNGKMKEKFTCHDCGRAVESEPNLVLRVKGQGAGVHRVKICTKCRLGKQPEKRSYK